MLCQEQKVKRSHFIVIDAESKYILYVFLKKTLQLDQCVSILYFFFGSDRSPRSYKSLSGIYAVYVCTICIRESNRRLFAVKSVAHGRGDVIM